MQRSVHLQHDGVEMDSPLLFDRRAGKEHVHEHGFAAADPAEDVEALGFRCRAMAEAQTLAPAAARALAGKRVVKRLQFFGGEKLGWVGLQPALGAMPTICGERTVEHSRRVACFCSAQRHRRLVLHRPPATLRIAPVI